ncbi:MAG TPA: right-handed parallel beta-helix repeat-containing protein, partial [Candidatus Binatia bacterium]|nr:right-handed parallel beta-helix repeat-containing protein [Candidatus Binatia bacterium]
GAAGAGGLADFGMVISNCLIYRVDTGIAVKDNGTASLFDTTLSASSFGMRLYQKFATPIGGGHVTNAFNNLIWGNAVSILLSNGATVVLDYSDVQGTNWPGTGNISADPRFLNPAADDFRLGPGSPAIGAGLAGADLGVHFPVGGIPPEPARLAARAAGTNGVQIWWQEDADNEAGFSIERSTDASTWQVVDAVGANVTNYTDSSALLAPLYFYRVRATNSSGSSRFSNIAGANRQPPVTLACGTLSRNLVWSPSNGMVVICSNVIVPANISLTLQAGTLVKLTNDASIIARAGAAIHLEGTEENRVVVQRWNAPNNWGELRADGAGASLLIRYADISGGQTTVYNGADALFEDSYFHDFHQQRPATLFNQPIVLTHFAGQTIMRRCHLNDYYEMLWRHGVNQIEDSLFEHMVGDAVDFDAAKPGSLVRRCTFRHGDVSNVDGLDLGIGDVTTTSAGVIVADCLMYDFPFDKGISIGEGSTNIVVTNCLIYGCDSAVAVKDSSTAQVFDCTFAGNDFGFKNFNKANPASPTGGGRVTLSWNNIVWDNITNISLLNGSILTAEFSDFGGTNYPGPGNIDADPLFLNAAQRDYRLQGDSPCIGSGRNGATMGAHFPVGAPMAPSHPAIEAFRLSGEEAVLRFWADSEKTYSVLCSEVLTGAAWTKVADVGTNAEPRLLSVTNRVAPNSRFYRLATPRQP